MCWCELVGVLVFMHGIKIYFVKITVMKDVFKAKNFSALAVVQEEVMDTALGAGSVEHSQEAGREGGK